jgi:hypothetical protein
MIYPKGSRQPGNVWVGGVVMNVPEPSGGPAVTPSPTPTKTLTPTPTPSVTATITPSVTPTNTVTPTSTTTTTPTPTPSPVVLLFDTYPALAGYSTRKLRSAYSGSAMRVRRETDNAEQDIGFVSNQLDTTSLNTFLGSAAGSVVKWYNQGSSGSVDDIFQNTAGAQPKIKPASGVIYTAGTSNRAVIFFNGSNKFQSNTSFAFGAQNNASVFLVAQNTGGSICFIGQDGGYKLNIYENQAQFDIGGGNVVGVFGTDWNSFTQGTLIRGNDNRAYLKKVQSGLAAPVVSTNLGTINMFVGNRQGNDLPLTGYIGEILIYATNQTSNITPISDSQINNYGV